MITDHSPSEILLFKVFVAILVVFLIVDLGFLNKKGKEISTKSALYQSIFWVIVSSTYGYLIYLLHEKGIEASLAYFSAYLTEKALSIDNIFVMLLILQYFKIEKKYFHKILYWGILGVIVFRGFFIFMGSFLVTEFHWVLYLFGVFLIYSGIRMYFESNSQETSVINPKDNAITRFCRRVLNMTDDHRGGKFIIFRPKLLFTPLFLVLVLIETTDLIFAVDSIPATFAITQNHFIIYTSNIFAVLGLRAMFFLLAGVINKFYLLQKGLSILLFFIGTKMLLEIIHVDISIAMSFTIILTTIILSILLSIFVPKATT